MCFRIEESGQGCVFEIRVSPRARTNRVVGALGSAVKIRIAATPERGAANKAVIEFLADQLKIRSDDITIITGHTSRTKRIRVAGLTAKEIESRLLR
jgi:uncharacterized protein (TIGR00251 family)